MGQQDSKTILMLTPPDWSDDYATSFYANFLRRIRIELSKQELQLRVLPLQDEGTQSDEEGFAHLVAQLSPDGVILSRSQIDDPVEELLKSLNIPYVVFGKPIQHDPSVSYVDTDNLAAFASLTSHLLERNHKRIALLNGDRRFSYARYREAGFRDAFNRAGETPDESLILFAEPTYTQAHLMATTLLQNEERPTAFVCATDEMAKGAIAAAKSFGLEIGRDLAVVGYGGDRSSSSNAQHLTTMLVDMDRIADLLAQAGAARVLAPTEPPQTELVQTSLVVGKTSDFLFEKQTGSADTKFCIEQVCLSQRVESHARAGSWSFCPNTARFKLSAEAVYILGVAPAESFSLSELAMLLESSSRRKFIRAWKGAEQGEHFDIELELTNETSKRVIHYTGDFIFNAQDQLIRAEGVVQDISIQSRYLEQLIESLESKKVNLEESGKIWSTVSHEIRTPLNAMIAQIGLMRDDNAHQTKSNDIDRLESTARLLESTLNGVLDFMKIKEKGTQLQRDALSIPALVNNIVEILSPVARNGDNRLVVVLDERLSETYLGDALALRQVLTNLVGNALKFTRAGQVSIDVSVSQSSKTKSQLLFKVIDTGIGIEESRLSRLFQAFEQAEATTARDFGGTGLGLSICNTLVKAMGGELSVTSELHKGSCFEFAVTLETGEAPVEQPGQKTESAIPVGFELHRGARILVVDDNLTNRMICERILSKLGLKVFTATHGQEALELLQSTEIELVFMDINMPIMNGFEATRAIRAGEAGESARKLPIISISSYETAEIHEEALEAGFNDLIPKVFDAKALATVIAAWI